MAKSKKQKKQYTGSPLDKTRMAKRSGYRFKTDDLLNSRNEEKVKLGEKLYYRKPTESDYKDPKLASRIYYENRSTKDHSDDNLRVRLADGGIPPTKVQIQEVSKLVHEKLSKQVGRVFGDYTFKEDSKSGAFFFVDKEDKNKVLHTISFLDGGTKLTIYDTFESPDYDREYDIERYAIDIANSSNKEESLDVFEKFYFFIMKVELRRYNDYYKDKIAKTPVKGIVKDEDNGSSDDTKSKTKDIKKEIRLEQARQRREKREQKDGTSSQRRTKPKNDTTVRKNEHGVPLGYLKLDGLASGNYHSKPRHYSDFINSRPIKVPDDGDILDYLYSLPLIEFYQPDITEDVYKNPNTGNGVMTTPYLWTDTETGNLFFVDPQGYDYPRYVIRLDKKYNGYDRPEENIYKVGDGHSNYAKGGLIKKEDEASGFAVHGLIPTENPIVMAHKLFSSNATIKGAIQDGKTMFRFDDRITRVEIDGKKSYKLYYVLTKTENGDVIVTENTDGKLKSMQYDNVAIVNQRTDKDTGKNEFFGDGGEIKPSDLAEGIKYWYLHEDNTKVTYLNKTESGGYIFKDKNGSLIIVEKAELTDSIAIINDDNDVKDKYTIKEIESKLGRNVNTWQDNIVYVNGIKYEKAYLLPLYRKLN